MSIDAAIHRRATLPVEPATGTRRVLSWALLVVLYVTFFVLTPYDLLTRANALQGVDRAQVKFRAFDEIEEGRPIRKALIGALGVIAVACLLIPSRRRLAMTGPAAMAGAAFLALAIVSPAWSDDPVVTLRRATTLVVLAVLAAALARLWTARESMAGIIAATGATLVIGVASEVASGGFTPLSPEYRFAGVIHPNGMAINCGILLLATVGGAMAWPQRRGRLLVLGGLSGVALFLTKSRGGLIAALCALVVMAGLRLRRRPWILAGLAGLAVGVLAALALFFGDSIAATVHHAAQMGRTDDPEMATLTGRTTLWTQLWGFVGNAPLLGYGYDSFWTPKRVLQIASGQGWVVGSAHSGYLDVLLSLGAIGAALWFFVLAAAAVSLWRRYRATRAPTELVAVGILTLLYVNMSVEVILLETSIPSMIGLLLIARALYVREANAPVGPARDDRSREWR